MERQHRTFTTEQLELIQSRVEVWKETDEMALLVYVLLNTTLSIQEVLSWFNHNVERRQDVLRQKKWNWSFATAPKLFPKTHQAYLSQWKRVVRQWFGIESATFEMLRRSRRKGRRVV